MTRKRGEGKNKKYEEKEGVNEEGGCVCTRKKGFSFSLFLFDLDFFHRKQN